MSSQLQQVHLLAGPSRACCLLSYSRYIYLHAHRGHAVLSATAGTFTYRPIEEILSSQLQQVHLPTGPSRACCLLSYSIYIYLQAHRGNPVLSATAGTLTYRPIEGMLSSQLEQVHLPATTDPCPTTHCDRYLTSL